MVYRNTKTGALLETDCQVSGGDWVTAPPAAEGEETIGQKTPESGSALPTGRKQKGRAPK